MLLIVMHTELSSPKVKSIRKNMMDQKGAAGSVAMAAGYTTKTRPGPTNQIFDIQYEQFCMKDLWFFFFLKSHLDFGKIDIEVYLL